MSSFFKTLRTAMLMTAVAVAGLGVSAGASAELKIAVLNTQRAVIESDEAKSMIEKIRSELDRDETSVRKLGEEIQAASAKLQKDADTLSDSEKRRLQKDIEDKQIDYQFQVNKLQKEVNDRQQEIFAALAPKVDTVLKELIEKEKYDMIIQRQNLLYAKQEFDITRQVTEALNKKRCLLYTSPSPRDQRGSRMPSSA